MKLFIDSVNEKDIERLMPLKIFTGITTTPTFFKRAGISDWRAYLKELLATYKMEVHAEAFGETAAEIISEAEKNAAMGEQIVSKIPIDYEGLLAAGVLQKKGYRTNMHLIFSLNQTVLAASAGVEYVCPMMGRLNDTGADGAGIISEMTAALSDNVRWNTKVMVSSIRGTADVQAAILSGAEAVTIPPLIIDKMLQHPLTTAGRKIFKADLEL